MVKIFKKLSNMLTETEKKDIQKDFPDLKICFMEIDKKINTDFIVDLDETLYIIDISALKNALPAYRKMLDKKFENIIKKSAVKIDYYKNFVFIGPNHLVFMVPQILR